MSSNQLNCMLKWNSKKEGNSMLCSASNLIQIESKWSNRIASSMIFEIIFFWPAFTSRFDLYSIKVHPWILFMVLLAVNRLPVIVNMKRSCKIFKADEWPLNFIPIDLLELIPSVEHPLLITTAVGSIEIKSGFISWSCWSTKGLNTVTNAWIMEVLIGGVSHPPKPSF